MLQSRMNLWDAHRAGHPIAITTNGYVKTDGTCVMGRGCAKEAALAFPELPGLIGRDIRERGNHVRYYPQFRLFTFPVKHAWWQDADPILIATSALELASHHIAPQVFLPRPGCGNGRLSWLDVEPIISPILDDRFTVVTF